MIFFLALLLSLKLLSLIVLAVLVHMSAALCRRLNKKSLWQFTACAALGRVTVSCF